MKKAYVFFGLLDKVDELRTKDWVSGFGPSATFKETHHSWKVNLLIDGKPVTLLFFGDRPDFEDGQPVKITIEHASTLQAPVV